MKKEDLINSLKRIRELTDYQRRAWQWFKTGCSKSLPLSEMFVELAPHHETKDNAKMNQDRVKDILEMIDYLLKDLDK